ncbi:MAG: cyclase family protein [Acidimicrobiales bacterium]
MTEYRAEFDAEVSFSNGGRLTAQGFRIDVAGPNVGEDEIAALFVASLGLLMVDRVELRRTTVYPEAHKGTRRGPSDASWAALPGAETTWHLVELSHVIKADMVTYPGLPGPVIGANSRQVDLGALAAHEVSDRAVLLHTGGDKHWGTPEYATDAPYLTEAGARFLVEQGARLVGIDSVNIDDIADGRRPAHSLLLAAGIAVVEHLTGLEALPPSGARFTAAPPRMAGFGTFPVRAYASVPVRRHAAGD